jgi:hypothetical protein
MHGVASRPSCMPRGLDRKSLLVTPRGPCRPSNLPKALHAATRAILDEAGPDAVSLREAARRVGVSATAAYRYFANKEELLASEPPRVCRRLQLLRGRSHDKHLDLPLKDRFRVDMAR